MRHWRLNRPLVVLLLSLVLIACSSLRFFYNQLDWLLPFYLSDYVTLDENQSVRLDRQINELHTWHCRTQVPKYTLFLRQVLHDVQAGHFQASLLQAHFETTSRYWYALTAQAAGRLADVFLDLTDAQVQQIFTKLADDQTEFREKFVDAEPDQKRKALAKQTTKSVERWLGDLNKMQQAQIIEWASRALPWQSERLMARERWQQAFRQAFAVRKQGRESFARALIDVFVEPQQLWTERYREVIVQYRASLYALLEAVLSGMTEGQKSHLQDRLQELMMDMQQLSCAAAPPP